MAVSLAGSGIPESLSAIIQDNTLERVFNDALFPKLLYRAEAMPELWQANLGERMLFTRTGLIAPTTKSLTPGSDPIPSGYDTEQWEAEARQHGNTIDTHMPSSYTALASLFLRNTQQLGLNSGQTMNRLARNNLFSAYLAGEAMVSVVASAAATEVTVSTLSGFTQQLQGGRLSAVSSANPLPITFTTVGEPANTVIGFVPADASEPFGPGTLSLGAPLTTGCALRDGIFASTRSRRLRVGGGATVDGIATANIITLDDIISAVSRLRQNNIPPHSDGYYHVHMEPEAEAEIFRDNHWQRLHQSLPESFPYRELAIGQAVGSVCYRNTESPNEQNVETTISMPGVGGGALLAPEIGAEVTNEAGVAIRRTIVTGGGALYEKYLDESRFITDAGVTGKIGNFSITNGGVSIMTNRIRYMLRSPQDRLQQVVGQTWSWSGDFPVPSDALTGDDARFKRAIVIEHA